MEASPDSILTVDGLTKRYDDLTAVDDVSFSVDRGEVVGILGPNGAGKTTLIKSILGVVIPTEGRVNVAGVDVHADPKRTYRHVGAMLEGARNVYWRLTVRENLAYFAALAGRAVDQSQHDDLLDRFGLLKKADVEVNELSRGQKQKVSLACTLVRGTEVVFLDEPTLGLDVEASVDLRREIRRLVADESITVILSSHDMDVVEDVCDRVVILNDGSILTDKSVDDLVDLFRTRAYRIAIKGAIPKGLKTSIDEDFLTDDWAITEERTSFEVTIEDGASIYDLLDELATAGCPLDNIESLDPDLEDVFLEVTNNGAPDDAGAHRAIDTSVGGDRL